MKHESVSSGGFVADYNMLEECWDLRVRGEEPRKLSIAEFEKFLKKLNGPMTNFEVRFLTKKGHSGGQSVLARDARHAITQVNELYPDVRITAVILESMWE